jgi:hypothetical protein
VVPFNQRPDDVYQTVSRSTGWEEAEVTAVTIDQKGVADVVDVRVASFGRFGPGVIDLIGVGDLTNLPGRTG